MSSFGLNHSIGYDTMGRISDHLQQLIEKQIKEYGIVVWYDPEGVYGAFCDKLSVPEASIFRWRDSFFRLRHEVDAFLEFIDEQGQPDPEGHVPAKILIYIPKDRQNCQQALVEMEAAGVIIEPGANAWQRNTRLRVVAEQVFRKVAPDQAEKICKKVEEGLLTLEELDRLAQEVDAVESGAFKLIFGTVSLTDVALRFAASSGYDQALKAKQALPELADFFENGFGFESLSQGSTGQLRKELRRLLLMGDVLYGEGSATAMEKYASLPLPTDPKYLERVREVCAVWRSRTDFRPAYVESAQSVEEEIGVADVNIPIETLSSLETFPVFERKLIHHAEEGLLQGNPDDALMLAQERKGGFWPLQQPDYQLRWALIESGARLRILGKTIRTQLKKLKDDPKEHLLRYTEGEKPWYLLDRIYRHLERQYSYLDCEIGEDHALLEKLIASLRQDYMETIESSAGRFITALEKADFQIPGFLTQDGIYAEKVAPRLAKGDKVAYFIVDALRYEMGLELVEGLKAESNVTVAPAIAQLPTITSVGMAALMPEADQGMELTNLAGSKMTVMIGTSPLKDRAARIKHFQAKCGVDVLALKLRELVKPSRKRQQEVKAAGFIIVTSQEIDQFGEEIEDESEARIIMDEVLDKLRKAIRNLIVLGVKVFVISADHGHLFGENIEGGMLMDAPGGKTAELHRRVWIGQGGVAGDGFIRIPSSQVHLGGPFELAFPKGLGCFKIKGGAGAYCHGGASLQEIVIPVISLEPRKTPPYSHKTAAVRLQMEKPKITTRFFSITVTYQRLHGIGSSEEIRVKIAIRANRKEVGAVVTAAYGFEEGAKEILLREGKPNAITLMLTDDQGFDSVTVHVLDAISQVELTKSESIPVGIAL